MRARAGRCTHFDCHRRQASACRAYIGGDQAQVSVGRFEVQHLVHRHQVHGRADLGLDDLQPRLQGRRQLLADQSPQLLHRLRRCLALRRAVGQSGPQLLRQCGDETPAGVAK